MKGPEGEAGTQGVMGPAGQKVTERSTMSSNTQTVVLLPVSVLSVVLWLCCDLRSRIHTLPLSAAELWRKSGLNLCRHSPELMSVVCCDVVLYK